jgi:hypothetical protein
MELSNNLTSKITLSKLSLFCFVYMPWYGSDTLCPEVTLLQDPGQMPRQILCKQPSSWVNIKVEVLTIQLFGMLLGHLSFFWPGITEPQFRHRANGRGRPNFGFDVLSFGERDPYAMKVVLFMSAIEGAAYWFGLLLCCARC